jgi:hypothetical protein
MGDKVVKTVTLKGKDKFDLDTQQWNLQETGVTIVKVDPDEQLPLQVTTPELGTPILARDTVSRRIEYREK